MVSSEKVTGEPLTSNDPLPSYAAQAPVQRDNVVNPGSIWNKSRVVRRSGFQGLHYTGKTRRKERKHPDIGSEPPGNLKVSERTDFGLGQVVPHITEKRP